MQYYNVIILDAFVRRIVKQLLYFVYKYLLYRETLRLHMLLLTQRHITTHTYIRP